MQLIWLVGAHEGMNLNKLKTTPIPNKNGSYGIKGGLRTPLFSGSVCHVFCRNPLILTDFYAIQTPIVWHNLGGIYFLQIWGVGVVRIIFRTESRKASLFSSTPMGLPLPQGFRLRGTKLRPWSKQNSDQNSDHARLCMYQGKEKLRPWSKFLGRENSDHGLNFGLPRGGGRSCLDDFPVIRNDSWAVKLSDAPFLRHGRAFVAELVWGQIWVSEAQIASDSKSNPPAI